MVPFAYIHDKQYIPLHFVFSRRKSTSGLEWTLEETYFLNLHSGLGAKLPVRVSQYLIARGCQPSLPGIMPLTHARAPQSLQARLSLEISR